ncbi:MAG: serine hydrolase domain-containing protein [Gemmatimonadota bacterium]
MAVERRRFLQIGGAAVLGGLLRPREALARLGARKYVGGRWKLSEEFLATLPGLLGEQAVPGVSIAWGTPGTRQSVAVAGTRSADGDAPVTPDTVFPCGSLSKPVLATVAIRLHSAGGFDLHRPLVEVLDGDVPTGDGASSITAAHALQHTTGLRNWRFSLNDPFVATGRPGVAWGYSGEGIILVQRALETVTGLGLEALAREHVFGPFGMRSSSFLRAPDLDARSATPFVPPDDRFADFAAFFAWKERALVEWAAAGGMEPAQLTLDEARAADAEVAALAAELAGRAFPATDPMPTFLSPNAAGGLRATAGDYLHFLHGWLRDADLRAAAFARPVDHPQGLRWGLGWGLEAEGEPGPFWHWGEGLGYRALAYADPRPGDEGEAMVILTNGNAGMAIIEAAMIDATGTRSPIFDVI